jgi:hypothetical protein
MEFSKESYDALGKLEADFDKVKTPAEAEIVMKKAIELTSNPIESVIESECPHLKIDVKTKKFYLFHNNVLSSIPLPGELVERILDSQDKEIDYMPLIRMWVRFLRNPNLNKKGKGEAFASKFFKFVNLKYVHPEVKANLIKDGFSEDVAKERATMYQMKITKEGLLNGYKVSAEHTVKYEADENGKPIQKPRYLETFDINTGKITGEGLPDTVEERIFIPAIQGFNGDPFSCEGANGFDGLGHFIKVGCTHALDSWDQVNIDDDSSCVKGLHFGGLYYIKGISGHIHNIFVDPMHVGAIPDDNTGAARCKQYFVHSSLAGVNGSIYHSSSYAKLTDSEWNKMLAEAVKVSMDNAAKAKASGDELAALS